MNWKLKMVVAVAATALSAQAIAGITIYQHDGFRGRAFTAENEVPNFKRRGFNDRTSSVIVEHGQWQVCEHANYQGRCAILPAGHYDSLGRMGMNDTVSSMRPVADRDQYSNVRQAPTGQADYQYRRRSNERYYRARVTSAHAVYGPRERRCWIDNEQYSDHHRGSANVGGAVVGAIIGGILGHQIGSGRGQDVATAGGAVAGAVVGANVNRNRDRDHHDDDYGRDVRRCETVASSGPPEYWDVTYRFRGVDHRAQLSDQPGRKITVNQDGEPRW